MPASALINLMPYAIGKPGMLASHLYAHLTEFMGEEYFNLNLTDRIFPYGRALHRKADGTLDLADQAGTFAGVILWSEGLAPDPVGYGKGDYVPKQSLGDIWVPIKSGLTVKPGEPVYYLKTAGDDLGKFTNVAAGAGQVQLAQFLSPAYTKPEPIALVRFTDLNPTPAPAP